jgi:hypothetical protein
MALVDGYLDRWLRPDIEHRFLGGLPSAFEMAHAARLENRQVVHVCELRRNDLAGDMSLIGYVMAHPKHADGKPTRTATLVRLDSRGKWARTKDIIRQFGDRSAPPSWADDLRMLTGES